MPALTKTKPKFPADAVVTPIQPFSGVGDDRVFNPGMKLSASDPAVWRWPDKFLLVDADDATVAAALAEAHQEGHRELREARQRERAERPPAGLVLICVREHAARGVMVEVGHKALSTHPMAQEQPDAWVPLERVEALAKEQTP
jgi:hypothetical protein